ncbi:MAG: Ig-like domain-containing protein [Oscillospiraceae bacterium]|nr:Ig-like domain-containing protein [Oscillospiraceae bacterium]
MIKKANSLKRLLIKILVFTLTFEIICINHISNVSAIINSNHKFDDSIFDSVGRYEFNIFGNSNTFGVDHYTLLGVPESSSVNIQNFGIINASQATYTKGVGSVKKAFLIFSSSDFHTRSSVISGALYEPQGILDNDVRTIAPNNAIDLINYPMSLVAPSGETLRATPDYLSDPTENPSERTAIVDVTEFIKRNGAGSYIGKDISFINAEQADPIASWEVVIIEENPNLPFRKTVVNAGASIVSRNTSKSLTVYQPGLRTKSSGNITGQILVTGDGGNDMSLFGKDYGTLIQSSNNVVVSSDKMSDNYHKVDDFFRGVMTKNGVLITDINPNWTNFTISGTVGDSNKDIFLQNLNSPLLKNDADKFEFNISTEGDVQHVNLLALTVDIEYPLIDMNITNNAATKFHAGEIVTNVVNITTPSQNKSGLWNSTLTIKIPAGTLLVDNSVKLDGTPVSSQVYSYDKSAGILTIPIGTGTDHVILGPNYTSIVNFDTITSAPGAVTLNANIDGNYMGVDGNKENVSLYDIAKADITYSVQAPLDPADDTIITGNGFIINVADVATLTDQAVLSKSKAKAWRVSTGEDLTNQLAVDKSKVLPEVGPYPATLSVNGVDHNIIISVIDPDNTTVGPNGPNNNSTLSPAEDTVIYGKGFTIKVSDVATLTNQDVLSKSLAKAWLLSSGADLTPQLVVNKTAVQPIVGEYPATLSVNGVVHTIKIRVIGPTINPLTPGATTVSGKGTPGDTIDLTLPNGTTIPNIPVDQNGNWSTNIPTPLNPQEKVIAKEKAPDGTVSDPVEATVPGLNTTAPINTTVANTTAANTTAANTTVPNTTHTNTTAPNTTTANTTIHNTTAVNTTVLNTTSARKPTPTIDPLHPGDTKITGTGTPGDTIYVRLPDGVTIIPTVVDQNGKWSVDSPKPLNPGEVVTAVEETPDGTRSDPVSRVVPNRPTPSLDPLHPGDTKITGTGTPGDTIYVRLPDGVTIIPTVVDPNGKWSVDSPKPLNPGEVVTAVEETPDGTRSDPVSRVVPNRPTPSIDPLHPGDTKITGTGTPGDTINVKLQDGTIIPTVVDQDGKWSVDSPHPLQPGEVVTVVEETPDGIQSDPVSRVVPNRPTPSLDPLHPGDTKITGTGTPGDTINVSLQDGTIIPTVVDPNGKWSVDSPHPLQPGEVVTVVEETPDGIQSEPVSRVVPNRPTPSIDPVHPGDKCVSGTGTPGDTIDLTLPDKSVIKDIPIDENGKWNTCFETPLNPGDEVKVKEKTPDGTVSDEVIAIVPDILNPPVINGPIKPSDTIITGRGDPGKIVVVTFPDGSTKNTMVGTDGTWKVDVPSQVTLKPGDIIKAYQTDEKGNKSTDAVAIVSEDKPSPPKINPLTPGDTSVSGKGTPGDKIDLTLPDGTVINDIPIDSNGNWSTNIPTPLKPGEVVKAIEKTPSGTQSDPTYAKTPELPMAPTINGPIKITDTKVTGTGTPFNDIVVTFPDGNQVMTTVKSNGTWEVTVPTTSSLIAGNKVIAYEVDKNGNKSPEVSAPIIDDSSTYLPITGDFRNDMALNMYRLLLVLSFGTFLLIMIKLKHKLK